MQVQTESLGAGRKQGRLSVLSCALLLSLGMMGATGCNTMLTDYERPQLEAVSAYQHTDGWQNISAEGAQAVYARYWEKFGDDRLNALTEQALLQNLDLQSAYLNVQTAQAQLGQIATNLHPSADASVSAQSNKDLTSGASNRSSGSSLNLSYEADLFGRLSAQRRSAFEDLKASAFDYWAMRLSVVASLSQAYWQYAYAREAYALGEADLKDSQRRLELVQARYNAGAADGLELDLARVNHLSVQDTLEQRRHDMYAAKNALTTLLGLTADKEVTVASLDTAHIPELPLVLPAELLSRRPDLMAAEARLRSALASQDEARLSFYPRFNLTAGLSAGDSVSIGRFLSDPIGALGAAITLPFLNYNELKYQEEAAMYATDQAKVNFVSAYITAVQEVSDAIDSVNYYQTAVKTYTTRYNLSLQNYQRYEARYRYGSCSLTDFLDAADTLRQASAALLAAKRDNLISLMDVMTAAGGDTSEVNVNKSTAVPLFAPAAGQS